MLRETGAHSLTHTYTRANTSIYKHSTTHACTHNVTHTCADTHIHRGYVYITNTYTSLFRKTVARLSIVEYSRNSVTVYCKLVGYT